MTAYRRSSLPAPPHRPQHNTAAAANYPGPTESTGQPRHGDRQSSSWTATQSPTPRESNVSPAAEFLGYVGGIVTALAAIYLAADWWDTLGGLGQVLTLLAGASALGAAAAVVGDEDAVARRLSTLLWWLTSATSLATTYLLVDRVILLGDDAALLAAGLTGLGVAGYQWRQRGGIALHLPTFVSLLVTVAGAAQVVTTAPDVLAAGLWLAGAGWIGLSLVGVVGERRTGLALGAVTAMGATQAVIVDATNPGLVLALATAAGLTGLAVVYRDWLLGGLAGLAVLVFGPQIVSEWLADVITGTMVALIAGITMLGGCIASIVVARSRRSDDAGAAHSA